MIDREPKKKKLSQATYESLCRKACAIPQLAAPNETVEDVYWWSICREVYRYLRVPFSLVPVEGASRGHFYRHNLMQLVTSRQSTLFDALAIGKKQISEAIERICEVHGKQMKRMMLPLSYGLPPRDEELREARARLFPHAWTYLLGGCVVDMDRPEAEALVCEECRSAEREWRRSNPRPTSLYRRISPDPTRP